MILKNYYKALGIINTYKGDELTTIQGNSVSTGVQNAASLMNLGVSLANIKLTTNANTGVVFGDGDSPVTLDDLTLSGNVISTLSGSAVVEKKIENNYNEISALYTITNVGTDSITIREILALGNAYSAIALERTVLDSPVTIPAGGVGQVTYTIRMNYPTA